MNSSCENSAFALGQIFNVLLRRDCEVVAFVARQRQAQSFTHAELGLHWVVRYFIQVFCAISVSVGVGVSKVNSVLGVLEVVSECVGVVRTRLFV